VTIISSIDTVLYSGLNGFLRSYSYVFALVGFRVSVEGEQQMTTDETPSVQREALSSEQVEAIGKKVGEVEQRVAALAAAQSAARRLRLVLPIGFLVFLCVFLYLFIGLKDEVAKEENLNKMTELAQERVSEYILPKLQSEAEKLAETAQEPLIEAFTKQAEKDAPKYTAALSEQGELLFANLETRLEEQINEHYKAARDRHEAVLKNEYPDLTDEQLTQLADNIEKGVEDLVKKYYVEQLKAELERMMTTINEFPVADPVDASKPGVETLEQELIGCLMEIVQLRLANPQNTLLGDIGTEEE
jgi:hypothetical protein